MNPFDKNRMLNSSSRHTCSNCDYSQILIMEVDPRARRSGMVGPDYKKAKFFCSTCAELLGLEQGSTDHSATSNEIHPVRPATMHDLTTCPKCTSRLKVSAANVRF